MSAVTPADVGPTGQHSGFSVSRLWPRDSAGWAVALVAVKIGLGLGLLLDLGNDDAGVVGSIVQIASYLVVLVAVVLQRRIGLILSAAFVGYSLAAGLATFGVRADRVVVLATSVALAVALLANALRHRGDWLRPTRELGATVMLAVVVGVGLAPLVSVSAEAQAADAGGSALVASQAAAVGGLSPIDFIPSEAKAEFVAGAGIDDDADIDCVLTALYRTFGVTQLFAWSSRDLEADERAEVARVVAECSPRHITLVPD